MLLMCTAWGRWTSPYFRGTKNVTRDFSPLQGIPPRLELRDTQTALLRGLGATGTLQPPRQQAALHGHSQLISRGHSNATSGCQGLQPAQLLLWVQRHACSTHGQATHRRPGPSFSLLLLFFPPQTFLLLRVGRLQCRGRYRSNLNAATSHGCRTGSWLQRLCPRSWLSNLEVKMHIL